MSISAQFDDGAAKVARKYKNVKVPELRAAMETVAVRKPILADGPKPANASSAVEIVRGNSEVDAQAALMKLRELVVGPTQQLNEARLEELLKIFEERETDMRAALRDMQKRNSELEVLLKQNTLDQLNAFKAESLAITDSIVLESKKACSVLREEIAAARKEAFDLVNDAKAVAQQKLEMQNAQLESALLSEVSKLQVAMKAMESNLETTQAANQSAVHNNISRALKEASENLARAVAAA